MKKSLRTTLQIEALAGWPLQYYEWSENLDKAESMVSGVFNAAHSKRFLIWLYPAVLWTLVHCAKTSKEYTSYKRYILCKPSDYIRYPKTIRDVQDIVIEAIDEGLTVKAFGIRHSQTDIICTEGIPVDMTGLQSKRMNNDNTATFGAGVNIRDATAFLRLHGRGLRMIPGFGNITIGGATGTGAHGSSVKYHSTISSQIAKVKIVNGKGKIEEVSNPSDLRAFKMHLGLLGVLVEVTLNTVALYKTRAHNYAVSDDILTDGRAVDMVKNTDQISLYWFPAFNEVVVANWTIVSVDTPGTDYTSDHTPSLYSNFAMIIALAKEIALGLTESTCAAANTLGYTILRVVEYFLELALLIPLPDYVPIYATQERVFRNPAVGYYDEMFAPICYDEPQGLLGEACAWSHGINGVTILDNEFGLELSRLGDFVQAVQEIIKKTPTAFPVQGVLMRFSDKSDIYMSTAYGRQTVHFEFYVWNRNDRYNRPSASLAGYQTILQTLTREFNGRSHWGKSGMVYHNSKSLDLKLDEKARQKFISVMNKYDPNEVFINNFGLRLKRKGTKVDTDPKTIHCALLDNCICAKNTDCASTQICTTLPGYSYRVCKTKNEVAEIVFDKSLLPPPLGVVKYLVSVVPTLVKGVISKCSLKDVVGTVKLLLRGFRPVDHVLEVVGTLSKQLGKLRSLEDVVHAVDDVLVGIILLNFVVLWSVAKAWTEYSSYRRYPLCKAEEDIRYPKTIQDVQDIVKEAIYYGQTVKAFGVRHSQTDIICTEGIPVDMTGLTWKRKIEDNKYAMAAGLSLRETTTFLRSHGQALRNTPAYGNITIGGAVGTGAHGSSIKYFASISSQVASCKIVDGKGNIQDITDPEDLKAFRLHLGLLVPLYKTLAYNKIVSDDILTNGQAIELAKNTDQLSLYWFPEFEEVVVSSWTMVDVKTPGTCYTNDHVPSIYSNFALISSLAKELAFTLTESKCAIANTLGYTITHVFEYLMEMALIMPLPDYVPIYATQQGIFQNPAVGYYDEMFAPICYDEPQGLLGAACPWSHGANSMTLHDNEFGFELSRLGDFINAVKKIVKETPTSFPMNGILMRFADKTDTYMSTSYGRQTVYFEFYLWKRDDDYNRVSGSLAGYQTILQTLAKEFNGRSHWGKSGMAYHDSQSLDLKLDETARQNFIKVMNKYDANEVFINNFGRRLKRTGTKLDTDPMTKHCAILDNCICSKDSDCGMNQKCGTLPGYKYNVCKTENMVVPVPFDRNLLPPPIGIVPYLVSTVPTLVKAVLSKCPITDVVGTAGLLVGNLNPVDKALTTAGTLVNQLGKLKSVGDVVHQVGGVLTGVLNG
ncbi:L-gulono-1,4-lactone dehydrogenase [Pseudolycoriella hygida]|uniref:L-gulono-1,4-lactone dehydrogenase n=1 Tax=Pseudolycoriella hygida TaxID=35572 RepID=A0A9Q0S7C6_9DIPT|nr:L-gulono-1,4-lactone dehydrogenase [Pseudolycoriella hygida]